MTGTILIADDDPCEIHAMQEVLRKAQILNPFFSVNDGAELMAYLQGEGAYGDRTRYPYPAIILLDLEMPQKSGLEVLEWLHAHPEHQELGVIVLTALENIQEIKQAYRLGAHSFLAKPFTAEDFNNLVRGVNGIELESIPDGQSLKFDTRFSRRSD